MPSSLLVKYQTDAGTVVRIRASDQTIGISGNTAVTSAVSDPNLFAFASNPGSRKKKELNARGIILQRFTGTGASRKRFTTFAPIFSPTAFAALNVGTEVTLAGGTYTIASKVPEA